jgi:hypothetical protein
MKIYSITTVDFNGVIKSDEQGELTSIDEPGLRKGEITNIIYNRNDGVKIMYNKNTITSIKYINKGA